LESLDLSQNGLTHLTADIANLRSLRSLILDTNAIGELPPQMGALGALRILSLRYTLILSLPMEIRQLSLKLLRRPGGLRALLFTDFLQMDRQIRELTAALRSFAEANATLVSMLAWARSSQPLASCFALHVHSRASALRAHAAEAAAALTQIRFDLNLAVQTDLTCFYNRVTIIP
jgi:Leucine-rich repeat (LRR) protein